MGARVSTLRRDVAVQAPSREGETAPMVVALATEKRIPMKKSQRYPTSGEILHASVNGLSLCEGKALSPDRDSTMPSCAGMPHCKMCFLITEHMRKR